MAGFAAALALRARVAAKVGAGGGTAPAQDAFEHGGQRAIRALDS